MKGAFDLLKEPVKYVLACQASTVTSIFDATSMFCLVLISLESKLRAFSFSSRRQY